MIHATISGNVGKDPESKTVGSGSVLEFSVASNSRQKVGGKWDKVTTWVRCSLWGKRGEGLASILQKGSYVTVRGELTSREYTDRDGNKRTSLEVRADDVELGPKRDRAPAARHYEHEQSTDFPADDGF